MKGWFQQYKIPKDLIGTNRGPNCQCNYAKKPGLKAISPYIKFNCQLWHQAYHLGPKKCKRLVKQPIYSL